MLRLHIVNPNTTAAMTQAIARRPKAAAPDVEITATRVGIRSPASIEGFYDDAFAVPGLLARIAEGERDRRDAHVIACFDDTGLDAARALAQAPVVGIGEAAFHVASSGLAHRFAVVTTLSRSIPVIEHNLVRYGLDRRCARVRATDVPVLALDDPGSNARARIGGEIARALDDDGADAIVLGCAGMADLAASLSAEFGFRWSTALPPRSSWPKAWRRCGSRPRSAGGYATPLPKDYSGIFAPFSPEPECAYVRRSPNRYVCLSLGISMPTGAPIACRMADARRPDGHRAAWHAP